MSPVTIIFTDFSDLKESSFDFLGKSDIGAEEFKKFSLEEF
jgi:hypothetical protein